MLSYPKRDNSNRSLIQVGGSEWSEVSIITDMITSYV